MPKQYQFAEPWSKLFPDQNNTSLFNIDLMIDGNTIKSLPFISADGGRYILPLPQRLIVNDKLDFYWETKSLSYLITEKIGVFYRENSLKDTADLLGIGLVNSGNVT